ncbi:MAG: glycosyltransferase family 2 protein [Candidatus Aminicenantes bacterium]|nr:glycosyltransferase family 2 protein [Candidatus Aminicenantes bacterium]
MNKTSPELSLVIPAYNEEENIDELYKETVNACEKLNRSYEIIFIDDGSIDRTFQIMKELHHRDPNVKVIRLRKNFGQTAALSAGFDRTRGEIIITMDADLQNDPADFHLLLAKIDEGFDLVNGWRVKRKDKFLSRRLPSIIANRLISLITGVKLHDYGCTLKAFRKDVIKNLKLYGELHRFIPAIASTIGVNIAEVQVNHRPRIRGKSNYTIFRFIKVILDLLTVKFLLSYSTRPLQIFGFFGLISGGVGGILLIYFAYIRLIVLESIANRPLLFVAILLVIVGIQFITLGLLAEIMVRAYHESVNKKIYFVREIIDSEDQTSNG